MSKKKSRTKAQVPAPLPEVTAEDIQKAKAFLAGLREDVSYTQAKKKLKRELGFASEVANALIVRLNEGVSRRELLAKLSQMEDISIEHFETYKPSLNDIFVARAGE